MPIIEPAIRPPSEAESVLLQVTLGCSANGCSFCGAYKDKPFGVKSAQEISGDIRRYSARHKEARRVFLMDGDALVLGNEKLIPVLDELNEAFPRLARVSSYANGRNITQRSREELRELAARKLSLIYMGLESGSQEILERCGKSSSAEEMIEAVRRAQDAGIKSSVIVLLGLGGRKDSARHARETAAALNRMQPRYLSFLSLMLIPGTRLSQQAESGEFEELTPEELLEEARGIISALELKKTIFRSDHASNYLPLEGSFPKDKKTLLDTIDSAICGRIGLRPEGLRGL